MTTPAAADAVRAWRRSDWLAHRDAHAERVDALTAAHRRRAARGEKHPVEDFLYTYYSLTPGLLRRWHPGAGVVLQDAGEYAARRWYGPADAPSAVTLDVPAFLHDRGRMVRYIDHLLRATRGRPRRLTCFGMHEWAMVHRQSADAVRHPSLALRLGDKATDEVLLRVGVRCTHYDAFRFFTPAAVPLNDMRPTRGRQVEFEQPACVHAGMDLLKWALKLGPLVPGDLLLDSFELALSLRVLDMEASPYDVRPLGYGVVPVETPAGRAEYVRRQSSLADRSSVLRDRVLEYTGTVLSAAPALHGVPAGPAR